PWLLGVATDVGADAKEGLAVDVDPGIAGGVFRFAKDVGTVVDAIEVDRLAVIVHHLAGGRSLTTAARLEQGRGRLSPCVCTTLRMVSRAVTQLYDDVLRPSGLRVTQFSILATIAHLGEANLKQLERRLAIDQTTLTRSLGLLERD